MSEQPMTAEEMRILLSRIEELLYLQLVVLIGDEPARDRARNHLRAIVGRDGARMHARHSMFNVPRAGRRKRARK